MILERSTISKLMHKYKSLKVKNDNRLVKVYFSYYELQILLLLTCLINYLIDN